VVELHGGRVHARSDGLGKGSEFVVELLFAASPWVGVEAPSEHGDSAASRARLRVLVADDNRDITESLALMLTMRGYEVRTALDGEEVLAAVESFCLDVALLDVGMFKASGHVVV
jgi:hypothetical protein